MNTTLTPEQSSQINAYITAMKAYDSLANVYSPHAYEKLDFHLQDALSLATIIRERDSIVDLGSGSGLPSVILAIVCPESRVYAVESTEKKSRFLRHVKTTLSLENFVPLHIDAESVLRQIKSGTREATALTAKAFMPPDKLAKLLQRFSGTVPPCYVPVSQRQVDILPPLPIPRRFESVGTYQYLVLGEK